MKKYLISFANDIFYENQKRLEISALKFGIDEVISYPDKKMRKTAFYKKNKKILKQKRGLGYWLWKPYIILDLMKKIKDGDFLVYSDSGIEIINNLTPLFKICGKQDGILLFNCGGHLNKIWTKRDCFVLMDCDKEKYWNSEQTLGSFQVYEKKERSIRFLKEYLKYGENENIITDIPNIMGFLNFSEFKDHRHDQSILSILTKKYGIELFRDPSQWGNYLKIYKFREQDEFLHKQYSQLPLLNSPYGTLLNHHREREIKLLDKIINKGKNVVKKIKHQFIIALIYNYRKIDGWLTPSEATCLYSFSKKIPPKGLIVEIGSWKGKSTYCLAKGINTNGKILAIDPFDYSGEPGSKKDYESRKNGIEPLKEFTENMKKFGVIKKIEIKKGISKDFVEQIKDIDLLFIDGDHSIEGCKYDYENYGHKIKAGGFLLFHDYNPIRKGIGPTWVIENLVIPSKQFQKINTYDSLCAFKKV